jgi:hypothetical protein
MIRLKQLLTEEIKIDGVTLKAVNEKGGPVQASWGGNTAIYRVTMSSPTYDGPVAITSIWKSTNKKNDDIYYISTNAHQKENIDINDLNKLVDEIQANKSKIEIKSALVTLTFTKKS